MKLSVSAYRAHASAHKKILSSSYQTQFNYGSTAAASTSNTSTGFFSMEPTDAQVTAAIASSSASATIATATTTTTRGQQSSSAGGGGTTHNLSSPPENLLSPTTTSNMTSRDEDEDSSNQASSDCKSPGQRTKSNQRWMKLRTTVQLSSAMQPKKPPLKREDSFLKRFSTRQIPETQETVEDTGSEGANGDQEKSTIKRSRMRYIQKRKTVVNPDENFYFHWLMVLTICVLYNLWTLIVRQSFPELQEAASNFWFTCDCISDVVFLCDVAVQLRTGYLEQGLMVYNGKKLACHYMRSRAFTFDLAALIPLDILQIRFGSQPLLRFPRFLKVYRAVKFYYIVESRTVWPNLWRVVNLIHILLILAHWFGCFYFLLSEVEGFQGDWVYPYRPGDYATLTRKYLGSLYWSTLTLTTIGDLPTPETNAEYIFTIVSYLIGVFIFATIVGQVGNVITNRNANRLEFERLLDGAKTYMRHHKVPGGMKRRVLRWYDYSWSRGRIQGGGDINTALGLLPDKLKTELALHVNLSVLKKVTIFQECQPEFLHDLVLKMKAYIFTPGDSICRKGEVAREMFIIADGILEVLSETGKVLTIMKAGDFFGEIGILNLDGLNKRTADVRSVGYSELFSLSREDVLAAMKDYPEAQEILQTLGRKRLMEVRCVNKRHAKIQSDKEHAALLHAAQGDNSSDNSASKRIVDKLKSDVKGIKNVLKKSRTARRSNESIEMQPLHAGQTTSSSKTPKGVLRRMQRVRSDEINGDGDENIYHHQHHSHHDVEQKTPSPIGAGLPLLSRLRLLKEKQDREERAVKTAPPVISPPHTHVTAMSPQESIQEEPEPEVIGAGLPLMQRLKLLKAKEDKIAKESQAKLQVTTPHSSASPSAAQSLSPTSPTVKMPGNASTTSTTALSPVVRPSLKVSFRDRIKCLQQDTTKTSAPTQTSSAPSPPVTVTTSATATEKETAAIEPISPANDSMKEHLIPLVTSTSTKSAKPSTSISLKGKIKMLGQQQKEAAADTLKPWSKLKLATVVNSGSSYSSLNNSVCEDSPTSTAEPFASTSATASIRSFAAMSKSLISKPAAKPLKNPIDDISINNKTENKRNIESFRDTTSVSDSELRMSKTSYQKNNRLTIEISQQSQHHHHHHHQQQPLGTKLKTRPCKLNTSSSSNSKIAGTATKTKTTTTTRQKFYRSVDDLSPEYGGLPFVKKLKILNERQKLAELESVMQTRSFSLDCADTTSNQIVADLMEPLTRSHSEASAMGRTNNSNSVIPIAPLPIEQMCLTTATDTTPSTTISTTTSSIEAPHLVLSTLPLTITMPTQLPLSPESNETLERRQLKSILKKLSEDKLSGRPTTLATTNGSSTGGAGTISSSIHSQQLLREPTLEGPPQSDNLCESIEDRSLFPFLSAQPIEEQLLQQQQQKISIDIQIQETQHVSTESVSNDEAALGRLNRQNRSFDHNVASPTKSKHFLQGMTNQKMFLKGSIEEQEYFGEVLLGIKQVIQGHLREVQGKFQERFHNLELEVKHRDEIISQLQSRIQQLEGEQLEQSVMNQIEEVEREKLGSSGTGSTGSSIELPFMRGDSLDTIFASSPPSDSGRPRSKCRNRKRSPRHHHHHHRESRDSRSWEESSDQESMEMQDLPRSMSPYRGMLVSDVTGNITRVADSVVLDINETSSSTNSSDSQIDEDEDRDEDERDEELEEEEMMEEEDEDDVPQDLHCDDWEIKMLAAELDRRESRHQDASSETISEGDEQGSTGLLRRRRKRSDTDTECSELETELLPRPRAASLDQHHGSFRRSTPKLRGVFKAMSFDRDKDRL